VGLLRSLSLAPHHARWTPHVTKLVLQVVNGNPILGGIPIAQRMRLLNTLEPYIVRPCFQNTVDAEILRAKDDMLLLWEYLLEFVNVVKDSTYRRKAYTLVVAIMERDEFSLTKLGFNATSQVPKCSPQHLQLAQRYKTLMIQTFVTVMKQMKTKGRFAEIIHFSAQSMAIFFFTLPLVGGKIVDALEKKRILELDQATNEILDTKFSTRGVTMAEAEIDPIVESTNKNNKVNLEKETSEDKDTTDMVKDAVVEVNQEKIKSVETFELENSEESRQEKASVLKNEDETTTDNAKNRDDDAAAASKSVASSTSNKSKEEQMIGDDTPLAEVNVDVKEAKRHEVETKVADSGDKRIEALSSAAFINGSKSDSGNRHKRVQIIARKGKIIHQSSLAEVSETGGMDVTSTSFIISNPDLFQWNYFASSAESAVVEQYMSGETENICITWLKEKHTFFLTFLEFFVAHVQRVSVTAISRSRISVDMQNFPLGREVVWGVIPAYDLLLECFWPLLRSALWWDGICSQFDTGKGWVTSQHSYTRVKLTARALLQSNAKLLNKYIEHTYENTNIYSLWSVDSCVEHMSLWFVTVGEAHEEKMKKLKELNVKLKRKKERLPDNFDFEYYWFGIENMLASDLFQVLLKVMSLLYNTLDMFSGQNRINLVTNLMLSNFFNLFCHWCPEVRTYFQLLLIYKLLRAERQNLPCFTDGKVVREYNTGISHKSGRFGLQKANNSMTYTDERSFERRMAVFDATANSSEQDDEHLLIDIMLCSKIDSYVRMCLENDPSIPEQNRVYVNPALVQYANLLEKYYSGINSKSNETLVTLAHRMIESSTNPYLN